VGFGKKIKDGSLHDLWRTMIENEFMIQWDKEISAFSYLMEENSHGLHLMKKSLRYLIRGAGEKGAGGGGRG
jgi:hypothetical protein